MFIVAEILDHGQDLDLDLARDRGLNLDPGLGLIQDLGQGPVLLVPEENVEIRIPIQVVKVLKQNFY